MTDDTLSDKRYEEICTTVRDEFSNAPVQRECDSHQLKITIMGGSDSERTDERELQLKKAVAKVNCMVDYCERWVPVGSSIHITAYVDTDEYLEAQDARKESEAMYQAEIAAERAMGNRQR